MSITDELRKWGYGFCGDTHDVVNSIADRIDAEYESAIASVMNDALYHANEKDMAELGWVRLPKDADGEYIHVGDVMVYADGNTCPMEVVALVPPAVFLTEEGPRYADMCRHYHEPTVENGVHREEAMSEDMETFVPKDIDWMVECRKWEHECKRLAARLEDVESDGRTANRMQGLVVHRVVEVRAEMLDAIRCNDVNQYNDDIRVMRRVIDELLDLLVEFSRPVEKVTG